jgi:hypothetical protein
MTEDEARQRWCPFARSTDGGDDEVQAVSVNRVRDGKPDLWCLCIASDCMAWRTFGTANEGFCGLAGSPFRG